MTGYEHEKFFLCEDERTIAKRAIAICKQFADDNVFSSNDGLQKEMEIFHLLVFLRTAFRIPKPKRIFPHEPLDAIIQFGTCFNKDNFWRGSIGVEITTCFGAEKGSSSKVQLSPGGHVVIDKIVKGLIRNSPVAQRNVNLPSIKPFREQFIGTIANKQNKDYEMDSVNKKVLLIVTGEPSDAGCSVTGSWFEKTFKLSELGIDETKFDKICVLNYFSSGKDNGPTITLDLSKEQKFYNSLFP